MNQDIMKLFSDQQVSCLSKEHSLPNLESQHTWFCFDMFTFYHVTHSTHEVKFYAYIVKDGPS